MAPRWLPGVVAAAGLIAGWGAARYAFVLPLIWVVMLVGTLALVPAARRLVEARWLLLGVGVLGVSFLAAADHELALRHSLLLVAAALLFGLARRAPLGDGLLAALAAGLALAGPLALAQLAGGLQRAQRLVGELPPAWREAAAVRLGSGRAFGTAALPGHFAALMLLAVPLLVEQARRARGWARGGWIALVAVAAAAVAATRSLAALLVAAALLLLLARQGGGRRAAWTALAALAALAVAVIASRHDLATIEPLRLRWINWETAAWAFARHPWLGVGLGGVGQAGLLAPTAAGNITPYAHNTYLELLAELGLAGAGLLAVGVVALVRLLADGSRSALALTAAVAVLPLHNLVDFSAYAPEVLLPWAILLGTLAGRLRPLPSRALPSAPLVVLLGAGALLAAMAWRGEAELDGIAAASPQRATARALASAAWTPWTVTPLELGAELAIDAGRPPQALLALDEALAGRGWVRPVSAAWAEARARLLLAAGRPAEALVWAREARRRAPWQGGLIELESRCAAY